MTPARDDVPFPDTFEYNPKAICKQTGNVVNVKMIE